MIRFEEDKTAKYLAILIGITACTAHLAKAVSGIANGIVMLLVILLWRKNKDKITVSDEAKGYIKAYGVFVACVIPSVLFSENPLFSLKGLINVWVWRFFVFLAIVAFIKRRDYLVNMFSALMLVSGIDGMVTLAQVRFSLSTAVRGWGFSSPVLVLAGILCMLLPIAVVILADTAFEKRLKQSAAFATVGILIGLLCNKSRSAWLTELIVMPVVLFRYLRTNVKIVAVSLLVLAGILGFMAVTPVYHQRVASITNTTTDRSNADRIWAWRSAEKMIKDHPVTGVGPEQFQKHYVKKYKFKQERQGLVHTHNNFIHVTVESGVIGLAGLLYFIGYFLYTSIRNYRKQPNPYDLLIFTTVFGYLCLFGQIEYSLNNSSTVRIMWFLLAVLLKLKETERPQIPL